MITSQEKSQIKGILQHPGWQTIERFEKEFTEKLKDDDCLRNSQWETIKALLYREGKVQGVREFIQELYKQTE